MRAVAHGFRIGAIMQVTNRCKPIKTADIPRSEPGELMYWSALRCCGQANRLLRTQ
jgi:hypothetical protein